MIAGGRTVSFLKASACGNDFLLIELANAPDGADLHRLTEQICDRHEGVGADGVEWMLPHSNADAEIRLINADGSDAEISGNGTRCVAAYLSSERGKDTVRIQTGAGMKTCQLISRAGDAYEFETAMGAAKVQGEFLVETGSGEFRGVPVSLGNPHYVVFVPEFPRDWQGKAAQIQRSPQFPQGVNVEFVVVEGKNDIRARFFERGAGETQSSGTGSCASAVAAIATGRAESPVKVHAAGGTQIVRREDGDILLRGSARLICRGEFFLDSSS